MQNISYCSVSYRKAQVQLKLDVLHLPLTFEINASESFLGPSKGVPKVRTLESSQ
jgi:hypothetical protein